MTRRPRTAARSLLRPVAALATALAVVLLTGCQTTVAVRLVVQPDGSGRVTVDVVLDAQAASRAGDLVHQVALGDLRQAGWTVTGPVAQPGGGVRFSASKPFADSAGATRALAEVSGSRGPLHDMRVERHQTRTRIRDAIRGEIDLSRGVDTFSDPSLVRALGGKQLSQLVAPLRSLADPPLSQSLRLRLTVTLPDGVQGSGTRVTRNSMSWQSGGGDRPITVEASGSHLRTTGGGGWYVFGAAAAGVLFLISLWWAMRGVRRDRRARGVSAMVEAKSAETRLPMAQTGGEASVEAREETVAGPASDDSYANSAAGNDTDAVASAPIPATSGGESLSPPVRRNRRSLRRRGDGKHARRRGRSAR